jgi:hypothetical protein
MKLKVSYNFDTWVCDERYNSSSVLTERIADYEVDFRFDDNHRLIGVDVYVPNVSINRDERGAIVTIMTNDQEIQVYSLVNYISNVLWKQTGKSSFSRNRNPEYVPESDTERGELENQIRTGSISFTVDACIQGPTDLSKPALTRYLNQKDALAMFADADTMTNPTGKYRELFRVLEHYFPFENLEFDQKASRYLARFDPAWDEKKMCKLRDLRNRCSHGKRHRDYITSNDLKGIREINANLDELKRIASTLLDNPPP